MARLKSEIVATVKVDGEDVGLKLRRPTNQELNNFLASRYETSGKGGRIRDNSLNARCELFDRLIVGVDNLEDSEGISITPERVEIIPANWKADVVFKCFEDSEIDIKN
jgi:hypothetical protein